MTIRKSPPIERRPMPVLPHRALARRVAELIVTESEAGTHGDFFMALVEELEKRGYTVELNQRGIHGTYVRIVKTPPTTTTEG